VHGVASKPANFSTAPMSWGRIGIPSSLCCGRLVHFSPCFAEYELGARPAKDGAGRIGVHTHPILIPWNPVPTTLEHPLTQTRGPVHVGLDPIPICRSPLQWLALLVCDTPSITPAQTRSTPSARRRLQRLTTDAQYTTTNKRQRSWARAQYGSTAIWRLRNLGPAAERSTHPLTKSSPRSTAQAASD
jgi:hypothetical protein